MRHNKRAASLIPADVRHGEQSPPTLAASIVDQHHYTIDNTRYPRVSEILTLIPKHGLTQWQRKHGPLADTLRDEASAWGSAVHEVLAAYDRGNHNKIKLLTHHNPDLIPVIDRWAQWSQAHIRHWDAIEYTLHSDRYGYAGTLDRVGMEYGESFPTLFDIKTSSTIRDSVGLQLYAYQLLYNETVKFHDKVLRLKAIHIPRHNPNKLKVVEFEAFQYGSIWLDTLDLYRKMAR